MRASATASDAEPTPQRWSRMSTSISTLMVTPAAVAASESVASGSGASAATPTRA